MRPLELLFVTLVIVLAYLYNSKCIFCLFTSRYLIREYTIVHAEQRETTQCPCTAKSTEVKVK